jgi:hypothetical protein
MLELLDPLQLSVCRLTLYRDDVSVMVATGFFYQLFADGVPHKSLVTNWHVLSGRNSDVPKNVLHSQDAIPNRLAIKLVLPERPETPGAVLSQEFVISLFDDDGHALWMEHPTFGHLVDVAVVKIGNLLDHAQIRGVNIVADAYDMAVGIGDPVAILGYPQGYAEFMDTPIWKRGAIASEPTLEAVNSRKRILIDATTRSGMSGSPVIVRAQTHYVAEDGTILERARASRLIGVYASRPNFQKEGTRGDSGLVPNAEIGYVYKSSVIDEIIIGNKRAPDYGCIP